MSMNRNEILKRLKEILLFADEKSADIIERVDEQTHLQTELGLNSVSMLYVIIATEEEFDIRFSDVGMNEFQTVGDVVDYIQDKLS